MNSILRFVAPSTVLVFTLIMCANAIAGTYCIDASDSKVDSEVYLYDFNEPGESLAFGSAKSSLGSLTQCMDQHAKNYDGARAVGVNASNNDPYVVQFENTVSNKPPGHGFYRMAYDPEDNKEQLVYVREYAYQFIPPSIKDQLNLTFEAYNANEQDSERSPIVFFNYNDGIGFNYGVDQSIGSASSSLELKTTSIKLAVDLNGLAEDAKVFINGKDVEAIAPGSYRIEHEAIVDGVPTLYLSAATSATN